MKISDFLALTGVAILVGLVLANYGSTKPVDQTPLNKMEVVSYDFYGHCDIIYLEVSNTSYSVVSEGRGLICSVGSIDLALREVCRALLDCDEDEYEAVPYSEDSLNPINLMNYEKIY